ncbi:Crp/Fnr family transcriptional regulator [Neobacillus drentensis]|uniref:Crp/Fnr family transcriptional regulator n=1 Tax=Neobacillus drentensis TaxID=220684 RepID=UPI0030000D12
MEELRYSWSPYLKWGDKQELQENTFVYHQGETGKGCFYLEKGGVKITLLSPQGVERTVNYVPEGMLFGEHGVKKEPYLTSAITTCTSVIYYFSDDQLLRICREYPEAARTFSNSLIYKFRILADMFSFLCCPVEQQMAHYLLKVVSETGSFSLDQTSFARYIGTSRITVNKILNKWKSQKLIQITQRSICILDVDELINIQNTGEKDLSNVKTF